MTISSFRITIENQPLSKTNIKRPLNIYRYKKFRLKQINTAIISKEMLSFDIMETKSTVGIHTNTPTI